jgi:hypothetical protein
MFGGIGFLLNGNLLVGVRKDSLLVRLGPDQSDEALKETHVSAFKITGRGTMKGWVVVSLEGVQYDDQLKGWLQRAMKFVGKLPGKQSRRMSLGSNVGLHSQFLERRPAR